VASVKFREEILPQSIIVTIHGVRTLGELELKDLRFSLGNRDLGIPILTAESNLNYKFKCLKMNKYQNKTLPDNIKTGEFKVELLGESKMYSPIELGTSNYSRPLGLEVSQISFKACTVNE
jgi:hypothetical protein